MEIEYGNSKLKKQLTDATEMKKVFGTMAKKVSARMDEIRSSDNLAVLMKIPVANCHQLRGNRKNEWSVSISGNYRLIFELNHPVIPLNDDLGINTRAVTAIKMLEATDYH